MPSTSAFDALDVLTVSGSAVVEMGEDTAIITGNWEASPVMTQWGGTGNIGMDPFAVICGGITDFDEFQSVPQTGIMGYVLTYTGDTSLPSWQPAAGGGGGSTLPDAALDNQLLVSVAGTDPVWRSNFIDTLSPTYNLFLGTDAGNAA